MKKTLKYIIKLNKKYIYLEILGLFFTIFYTIGVFITPKLSQYLIDDIIPSNSEQKVIIGVILFFLGCSLQPICNFIKNLIFNKISENINFTLSKEMFNRVINAPMNFFDNEKNGDIMSRITNDVRSVSNFITNFFVNNIKNIILILLIISGMLIISVPITIIIILVYLIFFIFNAKISKRFNILSEKIQKNSDAKCVAIEQNIRLISTIKIFNKQYSAEKNFEENLKISYIDNMKMKKFNNIVSSISHLIMIFALSFIYLSGSIMVLKGKISLGETIALGLYFQLLSSPLSELSNVIIEINSIKPIILRIEEYLKLPQEENKNDEFKILENIEFKNLRFNYLNEIKAINNINMKFNYKGLIGIIGESGAGKTSLMKLLLKFYDNYEGEILINGKSIKEYNYKSIRDKISVVSQEVELFNESIKDNINVKGNINIKEKYIQKLNLHKVISKLPNGYETVINERINLSGGEKQRIAILRAIAKNALIYIFDEPTSAVDANNEKNIKEIIEQLSKERLVIFITHNITLLENADQIYEIKDGKSYNKIMNEGENS